MERLSTLKQSKLWCSCPEYEISLAHNLYPLIEQDVPNKMTYIYSYHIYRVSGI